MKMTKYESIQLSKWLWKEVYKIVVNLPLQDMVSESDCLIEEIKDSILDDFEYLYGRRLRRFLFGFVACSFCSYDNRLDYIRPCFHCPAKGLWVKGYDRLPCTHEQSPYCKLDLFFGMIDEEDRESILYLISEIIEIIEESEQIYIGGEYYVD